MTSGKAARKCFLKGYGACQGSLNGEHYFSNNIMKQIGKGMRIGGFPWQPKETMQVRGRGSLTARVLCEGHNGKLSPLDGTVGNLFRLFDQINRKPEEAAPVTRFRGEDIERWVLKALCGMTAAESGARDVPEEWKALLTGKVAWPEHCGLYVSDDRRPIMEKGLLFGTKLHPETGQPVVASVLLGGIPFDLLLHETTNPSSFGLLRPRGIIFHVDGLERHVEFLWHSSPNPDTAIHLTATEVKPDQPHWSGLEWVAKAAQ